MDCRNNPKVINENCTRIWAEMHITLLGSRASAQVQAPLQKAPMVNRVIGHVLEHLLANGAAFQRSGSCRHSISGFSGFSGFNWACGGRGGGGGKFWGGGVPIPNSGSQADWIPDSQIYVGSAGYWWCSFDVFHGQSFKSCSDRIVLDSASFKNTLDLAEMHDTPMWTLIQK